MATIGGPNTEKDNLVFGYDTGYGVADNTTTTRFYPGESTDNKLRLFTGGNKSLSYGSNIYLTTAQETNVSDNTAPGGQYSRFTGNSSSANEQVFWSYSANGNSYFGNAITFSTYLKGSGTCHLTTYDNQSGYGNSSTITLTNEWVRYSHTRLVNASATSHWSGVRGILSSTNVSIAASQMEIKGHATPFTPTTRSDTASLIDLKRTTNIDVSNVSFDSTGQPDLDGTGDFIKASSTHGITGDITLEAVFNEDSASAPHTTVICTDTGHQYGVKLMSFKNSNRYGLWLGFGSSSHLAMVAETLDNNITYHLAGSWDQSSGVAKIYLNGVLKSTQSTGQTSAISLNEAKVVVGADYHSLSYGLNGKVYVGKVYNRVLSTDEIKQNYNAYKNRFNI